MDFIAHVKRTLEENGVNPNDIEEVDYSGGHFRFRTASRQVADAIIVVAQSLRDQGYIHHLMFPGETWHKMYVVIVEDPTANPYAD